MRIAKHGFSIKSEVLDIQSIKPAEGGKLPNGTEYSASVKFRAVNITEDEYNGTFKEVEEIIEYKIPCQSTKETVAVTELLRKLRASNTPVYVNTVIPKKYDGDIYLATSLDTLDKFLFNNGVAPSSSTSPKA